MRKILILATCIAAMPCLADESIPFHPVAPFKPGGKCLSIYSAGNVAYWLNHCPYTISVRWDDNGKCQNWGCLDQVLANAISTATISRFVRWCECKGTLETCNIPAAGC
jgi:hypothetical protein